MNILASYNWIKEYLKTDLSPEEFAAEMSLKSMSVESIDRLRDRYEHVVIGVIQELKPHPNADKLRIAMTDIGTGIVQIVCGGNNLVLNQRVVVALPGARVRWHGEGDLVELKETKIRGEVSFGMICAPEEVGFEKYPCAEGAIWDLTELTQAKAGTSFVEALNIDDVLFDMEVTTNRPDAMCILGLAREAGAALEQDFVWSAPELPTKNSNALPLAVNVEEKDLCSRYMAVAIENVKVAPSPLWLQTKLLLAGYKPINNIVDITNYILHEYGQPLHAFDYEKLAGSEIHVRRAKNGEKFLALDEIEYELTDSQLVIADAERPVAVAGVMGGKESGTWNGTTKIVFEAATFDAVSVRKTARALNLYSQSQSMFEKGLSPESAAVALAHAVELALEIAGGSVASAVQDVRAEEYEPLVFPFHTQKTRDRIGVDISDETMIGMLQRLGFTVAASAPTYEVTVPYWRDHDIEDEIDFTEEIARLYGYQNIPAVLPDLPPPLTPEDPVLRWEDSIKAMLVSAGYTELYGYSFVSAQDLSRYDLDPDQAVRIYNELTSEQTHMRTSLMPSLLKDIEANQGTTLTGTVFELQKVYMPRSGDLPDERTHLVVSHYGESDVESAFLSLKGVVEYFASHTGLTLEWKRESEDVRWHPTRSVTVMLNGTEAGRMGQVADTYQNAFKIDKPVVAVVLDLQDLLPQMKDQKTYVPIPEFQAVERDLAVAVQEATEFAAMRALMLKQDPLVESIGLSDVYRGKGVPDGQKSITLSIVLRAADRTLSSNEVDAVMKKIQSVLEKEFAATVR